MENKVIVYATSWCAFCHSEMEWLNQIGVKFIEKYVDNDQAALNELQKKINGEVQGVPVTDINGTIVFGFDRPKIKSALIANNIIKQ